VPKFHGGIVAPTPSDEDEDERNVTVLPSELRTRNAKPAREAERIGPVPVRFAFLALFALFIAAYMLSPLLIRRRYGDIIVGDAVFYYVYERSLILDHDLDFTNDYAGFDRAHKPGDDKTTGGSTTDIGRPLNQFSIGPALLGAPFFVVAHGLALALRAGGIHAGTDGFGYLEEASFGVAGIVASGIAAWVCYRVARRWYGVSAALGGVLLVWLGGSLTYYTLVSPTYSHAFDACAVSLWVAYWLLRTPTTARQWALFGALAGLVTLMRWQEAVVVVLPLGWLLWDAIRRRQAWGNAIGHALAYSVAAIAVFSPQMIAWYVNFGSLIAVPQGTDFFSLTQPGLFNVLFSSRHGLLLWTPAVLVGLIGLLPLTRRLPRTAITGIVAFVLLWYINGTVRDWWGGEAFGARRFLSLVPFLGLGSAAALDWLAIRTHARQQIAGALVGVLVILNLLFLVQYVAFLHGVGHLATYPTVRELMLDRFIVPFQFAVRLLRHR